MKGDSGNCSERSEKDIERGPLTVENTDSGMNRMLLGRMSIKDMFGEDSDRKKENVIGNQRKGDPFIN